MSYIINFLLMHIITVNNNNLVVYLMTISKYEMSMYNRTRMLAINVAYFTCNSVKCQK